MLPLMTASLDPPRVIGQFEGSFLIPRDVKIIPGADAAIAHFVSREYKCVGISNQGGVAAR